MNPPPRLTEKSLKVLRLIADGLSYSRIVEDNADLNYHDIFFAAEEAVWLDERLGKLVEEAGFLKPSVRPTEVSAMERAKQLYPRAYTSWTAPEDAELSAMHARGLSKNELGEHFQRQPSAIQSRLRKLGLIKD